MKIERIETFLVPPRWLFCRVETSDGVVGWGEPVVEGRAEGPVLFTDLALSFWGGVDPGSGIVIDRPRVHKPTRSTPK